MNILFVCSSNICRSAYCEYHLKRLLEQRPELLEYVNTVRSSAVFNQSPKIFNKTVITLQRDGFTEQQIYAHRPTYLYFHYKRFREADVIIGMTRGHGYLLPIWLYPKFITLSELLDGEYRPIPDPFMWEQARFDEAMDQLKDYMDRLAQPNVLRILKGIYRPYPRSKGK